MRSPRCRSACKAKLLRVLQEREVERLGGRLPVALDVARARDDEPKFARRSRGRPLPRRLVSTGLNVFPLSTAPLRERRDDVLPLAMRLLTARCRPGDRIPALSADAAQVLLTYPWPGNVRELDNVMQRALILATEPVIQPEHIQVEGISACRAEPREMDARSGRSIAERRCAERRLEVSRGLSDSLSDRERALILEALKSDNGNRQLAAKRLGISPRTLRYKLAKLREAGVEV